MGRLLPILFLINIILIAAALISCLSSEDEDIRVLPRIVWVIIILLFAPVGPIVWFVMGRQRRMANGGTWRAGGGFPENDRPPGTIAPDDNPDFLRKIEIDRIEREAAEQSEEERELLRKWEEDLRRREEELRKKEKPEE